MVEGRRTSPPRPKLFLPRMTWGWKEHESTEFVVPEAVEGGEVVEARYFGAQQEREHMEQADDELKQVY